jgi:hypothetical protein
MAKKKTDDDGCQELRASLDVYEQSIVLTQYQDHGKSKRVFICPDEAAKLFGNSNATAWFDMEPQAIRLGVRASGHRTAAIVRPAGRMSLRFELGRKKVTLAARLPNLLAIVSGDDKGYSKIEKVFAFWGRLKAGSRLYLPPLPNLAGSDGDVCMGNINMKLYRGLPASEFFQKAYLQTAFNEHHRSSLKDRCRYKNIRDFLRRCPVSKMRTYLRQAGVYGQELFSKH